MHASVREQTRILVIGHAEAPTGFSRVLHSLLCHLTAHYEVHHFAPNCHGEPSESRWTVHANPLPIDVYGLNRLRALVESLQPSLVLVMQDLWVVPKYLSVLRQCGEHLAVVAYCPVDARILRPAVVSWIPEVSRLVVYTNFGKRVLEECVTALRAEGAPFPVPDIAVIPHGTATDRFYPHPSGDIGMSPTGRRALARQALFPVGNLADDAFIVLNACHNQPRKRIDLTVEGFALFARNKPNNVHLYLHMGMKEVGWNVVALAKEAGIENRLLVTAPSRNHPWVSDDRLNLIYNACDVGINTASAEGWGLVSFEHAATEAAQVVPRHGACEELWADAAVMVEPTRRERAGLFLGASIVSPEGVANALEILYQDRAYLCAMSQAAYANATKPMYRWENIAKVWKDLLDQALHSKRPLVGRGNR